MPGKKSASCQPVTVVMELKTMANNDVKLQNEPQIKKKSPNRQGEFLVAVVFDFFSSGILYI